jgi:hypothetical protein
VSVPPIPTPLQHLGQRPFSFYPPIVNVEHNAWVLCSTTWNEVQVRNTKTEVELWVPHRFLGEVSSIDEPVILVGLAKELEYKQGVLLPHVRRVIEMPRAVNESARSFPPRFDTTRESPGPAPVVAIRVESESGSRARRMIRGSVAAGIIACVAVGILFRDGLLGSRSDFAAMRHVDLSFTAYDDYRSIVSKFGEPADDRWRSRNGIFRLLWYPQRSVTIVLAGADRGRMYYVGAVDRTGRIVHTVELPDGRNSLAIIRKLRAF